MIKHKFIRKATAFALIFALCCGIITEYSPSSQLSAATTAEELEALIKDIEEKNAAIDAQIAEIGGDIADNKQTQQLYANKLSATKDQIDYYNNLIYYKELEISEKEKAIQTLATEILDTEAEIATRQDEIDRLNKENELNLEKFGEIIRAMYIVGDVDFASIMAQSSDFYDMLVRTKMIANISQQNVDFMDELSASIDELEQMIDKLEMEKKALEDKKTELSDQKTKLEAEKAELDVSRSAEEDLNASYTSDYNKYSAIISDLQGEQAQLGGEKEANQADIDAYEAKIQALIRQEQSGSSQIYDNGGWIWPVERKFHYITTYFGYDAWRGSNHSGVDIGNAGINGTNIYASKSGTVIVAKTTYIPGYSYGKYVVIDHGDGYSTLYGHCSDVYVSVGQVVSQGDVVAAVGSTGWSTGPHLHFEVRLNGVCQNPFNYVSIPD